MSLPLKVGALANSLLAAGYAHAERITLPPDNTPKSHWPWWLRILAVLAVLAFVQIVARSVRGGASRSGPGPTDKF